MNENEIRITTQGRMRNYITYATILLQEKGSDEIALKAMGRAISKTVMIAELIKRQIAGLHQNTAIGSTDITVVDELPPDNVMRIYLLASGKAGYSGASHIENSGGSRKPSNLNAGPRSTYKQDIMSPKCYANGNGRNTDHHSEKCLWLVPSKNGGSANLYPADIIPFYKKTIFLDY